MGKIVKTQVAYKQGHKSSKDSGSRRKKKNTYGIPMSVLNMMNAVLGSGILGLANAVSNVGIVLFMLVCVQTLRIGMSSLVCFAKKIKIAIYFVVVWFLQIIVNNKFLLGSHIVYCQWFPILGQCCLGQFCTTKYPI